MTDKELWFWLSSFELIGPVAINALLNYFGSPRALWEMKELPSFSGSSEDDYPLTILKDRQRKEFADSKHNPEEITQKLSEIEKKGIRFIEQGHCEFPEKLKQMSDCPAGLFLCGKLPCPDCPAVAIVGSRQCDEYGRQVAEYFGRELARRGVSIISGMATGIDGDSQRAAIRSGGYSLAVLGCGVDICYPKTNYNLYEDLIRNGGVVSEYLPGARPMAYRFPRRNRLISAFSDAVLVVEARKKSGSLITADQALEQGREVMAIPGRLGDDLSEGCNQLIRQGAAIITCVEDVLEILGIDGRNRDRANTGRDNTDGGDMGRKVKRAIPQNDATGLSATKAESAEQQDHDRANRNNEGKTDIINRKKKEDISAEGGRTELEISILSVLSSRPLHLDLLSERLGVSVNELMYPLLSLEMDGMVRQASPGQYVKEIFS